MGYANAVSATILLASLGSAQAADWPPDGTFRITMVAGAGDLDPSRTEFVVLETDAIAMWVGCNRMRSSIDVDDGSVTLGPVAMTRMACPPPLDAAERAFTEALEAVSTVRLNERQIELADADGDAVIVLERAD